MQNVQTNSFACGIFRRIPSGGFRGGARPAQNFLNFMQFFAKFGKIICWRPPPGGLAPPPTGNPGSAPEFPSMYTLENHIKFARSSGCGGLKSSCDFGLLFSIATTAF